MIGHLFSALLLVWTPAARAACEEAISSQALAAYTDQMVASYTELDLGAVPAHAAAARAALPCVGEALSPEAVSAFLRGQGLALYLANQADRAAPWFAGAIAAAPAARLPASIAPDQSDGRPHPLRAAYEAAAGAHGAAVPAPELEVGWLQIDGARGDAVPTERPYVVQQFSGRGELLQTVLVSAGEPLQLDDALAQDDAAPEEPPPGSRARSGRGVLLSGAGLALGGGAAAATWATREASCTLPDDNNDGYADCPAGASAAFYGGLAIAAISGATLSFQLSRRDAAPTLQLSASQGDVHANLFVSF